MAALDWLQSMLGGGQPAPRAPQSYDVGPDTTPLSLDRTPVNDPYTGTALHQLMGKLGDIGTAIPGLVERAQLGGMNALGMRQPGGDIYRSKLPVAPGIEALSDAANFATGGLQSSLFPAAGAYREAARYGAREVPRVVGGLLADEMGGIRAFHGSPHSFDRFDLSKIGTGEGAQAYGHGLYFAENEGVARGYRDALAVPSTTDPVAHAWDLINNKGWSRDDVINELGRIAGPTPFGKFNQAAIDAVRTGAVDKYQPSKGHMYEVDINADPKAFLDWDKPLGQQSQEVRDALVRGGAYQGPSMSLGGDAAGAVLKRAVASPYHAADLFNKGGDPLELTMPDVSQRLNQAGIPGIRYLDQGSRGAGQGSSNYAIFDPSIIEILRKYGILPPVAAGGLLGAGSEPPT